VFLIKIIDELLNNIKAKTNLDDLSKIIIQHYNVHNLNQKQDFNLRVVILLGTLKSVLDKNIQIYLDKKK